MPLFGSRMVCETANYKYIEKRDKKFAKRENVLRRWVNEKRERRARLRDLKEKIQKVNESKCKPCEGLQRSESVRSLRETISPRLVIFDQPHADNNNQQRYSESSPSSPVPGTEPTTPSPSTPAAMGNEDPRFNHFFTKPTATAASRRRSKRSSLRRDSKHGSIGFTHDINGHKLKAAIANNGGGNVTATASVVMAGNKRNGGKINCDELGASKNKLKKGMLSMVPSNKYARLEEESVISAQDSHRFSLSDSHQGFGLKEEKTTTCGSCTIL